MEKKEEKESLIYFHTESHKQKKKEIHWNWLICQEIEMGWHAISFKDRQWQSKNMVFRVIKKKKLLRDILPFSSKHPFASLALKVARAARVYMNEIQFVVDDYCTL